MSAKSLSERMAAKSLPDGRFTWSARQRLADLMQRSEPQVRYGQPVLSLVRGANEMFIAEDFGPEPLFHPNSMAYTNCLSGRDPEIEQMFVGIFKYLTHLLGTEETSGTNPSVTCPSPAVFMRLVNDVLNHHGYPKVFNGEGWTVRASSEAEALRIAFLRNSDDVAGCKQGDPQVEIVASTIQAKLAGESPTLVDYGAGLGRLLSGLSTAKLFSRATYVAVDEPVNEAVKELAKGVGATFIARSRDEYLADPNPADVVILVNVLHHIPFADLPRQIDVFLRSLKPSGVLVIQEIGRFIEPEQYNVPWAMEDIISLFDVPGCVSNPRSTTTRNQHIPLTNMIVHLAAAPPSVEALAGNVRRVWEKMKLQTVDDIRGLLEGRSGDEVALHHLMFTNANLDLARHALFPSG